MAMKREGRKVVDVRFRPPTGGFLGMTMYQDKPRTAGMARAMGLDLAPSTLEESMPLLVEEMDSIGEYVGCVSGLMRGVDRTWGWIGNDEIHAIVEADPEHFVGIGTVGGHDRGAAFDDIDRCIGEYGFKAIVMEPGTQHEPMYANDPRLYPIYGKCADLGVPVFLLAGGNGGPDVSYSDPVHVERLAIDMPELKIVVLHGGWPWVTQVLHVAFRRPNIYISPDMYLSFPGGEQYIQAANTFLGERMLYGTSYPFAPLVGYFEKYLVLGFDDAVLDNLLYENARKLLQLP